MSHASDERLHFLTEEACEVGQIVQKIHRFGMEAFNPEDPMRATNRMLLHREIGDLLYTAELMVACGDLQVDRLCTAMQNKAAKLRKFSRHQDVEELPVPCTIVFANPPQGQRTPTSYIHNMMEDIRCACGDHLRPYLSPHGKGWAVYLADTKADFTGTAVVAMFAADTVEEAVRAAFEHISAR